MMGMTQPSSNTSVIDGTRLYYEQFAAPMAAEGVPIPAFGDLTADQARLWMLAYAVNVEMSVRVADAILSVTDGRQA